MRNINIRTALIALVVSLGVSGAAGATAAQLFTGKQVANNSLTGADIKDIRGGDIAGRTVQCRNLAQVVQDSITACNGGKTVTGSNGSITVNAPKGDKGDTGSRGADGVGINGLNGAKGSTGPQGESGAPGPTGATGEQGTPGAPGQTGAAGHDAGLPSGFFVTNKSVGVTKGGLDFGPYADGGAAGGSLYFNGLNGKKLSDIVQLSYAEKHTTSNGSPIAAPYLRVFLNGDANDVVFDATKCASTVPAEGTVNTYEVTTGEVRYTDDSCDGVAPDQQAWADVLAAHGDDIISGIYVTTGFAGGADLSAKLTDLSVNGTAYHFGS